ncbi:uncharacterized protein PV07_00854 [Cladophialophora immunda]|uniref:GED domain-containing protein n=1 Tax=Cladophialophora immunda TaxID=569365 RepID=A0A0D2B8W7_9EURO|nr:uncharacterized protein PV07_00854 [Cladophialophora immunda]KIW34052.1 hypothetical protein PV07_00854 [Cladophialophora immunda]
MLIEDAKRLEKIDRLYELRLDQYISLPVLAVVGDQSSGKSSVLEGLTGLPLPRDSGLCTRFPTQIVFKRSQARRIEVSIIPSSEPGERKKVRIHDFSRRYSQDGDAFDPRDFVAVLKEAAEIMEVPSAGQSPEDSSHSFSNDILKIEMAGPQHEHFSVIDLPGLFRKPTPGQTTKEDMVLVKQMVASYLNNARAIILAVVPANVDLATQEIIQMAEDADPERTRTLGVLTKPDLVDRGAESAIIDLVKADGNVRGLGYTLVCNRSQSNLGASTTERDQNEIDFFNAGLWSTLPKDRVGIAALKQRLNALLVGVTRNTFADVMLDLENRIDKVQQELDSIGSPRTSPADQRLFLLQISTVFQSLATKAIDGYYGRDLCFERCETLRLATVVMVENERFSQNMFRHGSRRRFSSDEDSTSDDEPVENDGNKPPTDSENAVNETFEEQHKEYPELRTLKPVLAKMQHPKEESVQEWITRAYRNFKGFEIGTTNPSLLPSLIREQTSSWHYHAGSHTYNVIVRIHSFLQSLLHLVCSDTSVCDRIWVRIAPTLKAAYKTAMDHVSFLVNVESSGFPVTLNHYFVDNLKKQRLSRIEKRLGKLKSWHTNDESKEPLIRLADTVQSYVNNEQHSIEDLHDILKSYHKVARKRFVDAVCKQVVDHHLICSPEGPLWALSPQFIARLNEDELHHLAGEDEATLIRRKNLKIELESLLEGQDIIQF